MHYFNCVQSVLVHMQLTCFSTSLQLHCRRSLLVPGTEVRG